MTKRGVLLQALASTPADVARLVRPLSETAAGWKPEPGAWSPRDIVSHLIQVECAYLARLARVIAEDEPAVPAIHPNAETHDQTTPLVEMSDQFSLARQEVLSILEALPPGAWQRAAIHETKGRMTLRFLVHDLVGHDIEHTNQLVETVQSWRAIQKKSVVVTLD